MERKTRVQIIRKIVDRSAAAVTAEIDKMDRMIVSASFRAIFKSIIFDNGMEFSDVTGLENSVLTKGSRTTLFYVHPYSSCKRGINKNANGIIRRFLPKGTAFAFSRKSSVREILDWINSDPRRVLRGKLPWMAIIEKFPTTHTIKKLLEVC